MPLIDLTPIKEQVSNEGYNLSPDQQELLLNEFEQQQKDLKQLKAAIITTLSKIGIINEAGEITDEIDWKKLFSTVKGFMWDSKKSAKQFEYLKDLAPLIEKYKDL